MMVLINHSKLASDQSLGMTVVVLAKILDASTMGGPAVGLVANTVANLKDYWEKSDEMNRSTVVVVELSVLHMEASQRDCLEN